MSSIEEKNIGLIASAIVQKKLISFGYKSQEGNNAAIMKSYLVEPYLIGQHKTTQNLMLNAYFLPTDVQKVAGETEDWKFYLLKNIKDVVISDISLSGNRPKYNPNPKMIGTVLFCTEL